MSRVSDLQLQLPAEDCQVTARLTHILDGLSRRERRMGDDDVSRIVLNRFTADWSDERKKEVAKTIRARTRTLLQARRAGVLPPSKLL